MVLGSGGEPYAIVGGMVAMIALFGIAWMADTFIANNEEAIVQMLGDLAERWPFMIAVAIFGVAALTTSQSAATRTMVPLGLALGIGAGYMIAMWTAVVGVLFLPANGTQIAAAEAAVVMSRSAANLLIGAYDVDLTQDFLQALVNHARITLHVNVRYGRNLHHVVEAIFKATARALRAATAREGGAIPSTKGVL